MQLFIRNKKFASGVTTLIIFEWGNGCIMKKVNSVEESGLLIEVISKKIKNKEKNKKEDFSECY